MQDFSSYGLIIDARSPREFHDDHIPGSVNMPVLNDEQYAEVGTLHRTDKMAAYLIGVRYSLKNIAKHLDEDFTKYDLRTKILVYCFRGGKRSKLWIDALQTIGYSVEKLQGGWKGYRRWVNEQLTHIPSLYRYNVLSGPTGCGKTRLLYALREAGSQVLDLEDIASHRGSVLGLIPGKPQPSQKYFDSLLLRKFSSYDPSRVIWVEAESKKIGNVQLPDALLQTMRKGLSIQIKTEMHQRVLMWREDYHHFEENPLGMLEILSFLRPLVGSEEFAVWEKMARQNQVPELFERLMRNHYDPAYRRSTLRNYPAIASSPSIAIHDLTQVGLLSVATSMQSQFGG